MVTAEATQWQRNELPADRWSKHTHGEKRNIYTFREIEVEVKAACNNQRQKESRVMKAMTEMAEVENYSWARR